MAYGTAFEREHLVRFTDLDDFLAVVNGPLGTSGGFVGLPVNEFRISDANGVVGNIAANGGLLASDTAPPLGAGTAGTQAVTWATGSAVPLVVQVPLHPKFDGTQDVFLDLEVYSGTTDAATFNVATAWDGGAVVTDSASDATTKSATTHQITATIDKADVPDTARHVTIVITPPTHATNAIGFRGAKLRYSKA